MTHPGNNDHCVGKVGHCRPQQTQCVKAACPAPGLSTAGGTAQPVALVTKHRMNENMSCTTTFCFNAYFTVLCCTQDGMCQTPVCLGWIYIPHAMQSRYQSYITQAKCKALTAAMYSSTVLYDIHCLSAGCQKGMYPCTCSPRTLGRGVCSCDVSCMVTLRTATHRYQKPDHRAVIMGSRSAVIHALITLMLMLVASLSRCHAMHIVHHLVMCSDVDVSLSSNSRPCVMLGLQRNTW